MPRCFQPASRHSLSGFLALAVAAVAASLLMSSARAADADLSTPKKAALAFATAMQEGDVEAMKQAAKGTDEQFAVFNNIATMFGKVRKYEAAAIKKFGDAGKLPPQDKIDLAAEVEKSDEKIEGDKATLIDKSDPDDKHPMTLSKDGGNWKVNLKDADPKMLEMSPKAKKAGEAIDTVIKGIEDGKYKTAMDALNALGEIMATLN